MGLVDDIPDGSDVAFDANSIIYYVEEHDEFLQVVEPVFEKVIEGRLRAHASHITLLEVLVGPLRDGLPELAQRYREILTVNDDFTLHPLDMAVAEKAASLRASARLRTPDAIVAASAIVAGCGFLVSNDPAFGRVAEIKALLISDYA